MMELKANERIDDLHRRKYKIIQNPKTFCFGMDAVLLSGFAQVKEGEHVLDLGTGTGIIPILLEAKTKGKHFIGLEIQEDSVEMATRSVHLNGLDDKVSIVQGDIKEADSLFPLSSFDVVTSNPPYMQGQSGLKNRFQPKTIARHEVLCTLEDVIKTASSLVKVGGRFYMVHRPHRLPEIMVLLKQYKCEPKRMRFVHPYVHKEPNMILIESVRHGKPLLKVEPPLIVYEEVGQYTDEIYNIYGYATRPSDVSKGVVQ
ncbi:tRNA1(Val) (adenine(37)-N6)-methyltransferase [Vallitalea pronyensis]|uniref:tRNA1(Val) (Adenine(37)-N6)-methyltransferase n=1 Tax=Vallitalea pronyensis TaxID=1348613 RepID=A0A8J8MG73_9FIRM|nr:tRNA1(Val) (adenine(37)-N6)-methyltransferase [Vallitalea pronyensis]QUI21065.1 tRNA1(Val) (adenine(37)-N6)-methyltransferase [Vallitalea pronyensis]